MLNEVSTPLRKELLPSYASMCMTGLNYSNPLFSGSYNPDGLNGRCYYCPAGFTKKGYRSTSVDDSTCEM